MTNTEMLREAIKGSGLKISEILKQTNIRTYATLRAKIENRSEFTASEILKLCDVLHLDNDKREAIFFANDAESYSA